MTPDRVQELFKHYQEHPDQAKKYVEEHEFSRQDIKLLKKSKKRYGFLLGKEARKELDHLIDLIEQDTKAS